MAGLDEKSIEMEQRDLSILLLQKMVQITKTIPLQVKRVNYSYEEAIFAQNKQNDQSDKSLHFSIFHKLRTDDHYIRFDVNNKLIRIGDTCGYYKKNDQAAFFKDNDHGYNYLSALYFFILSSGFKCLTAYKERSAETKRTIDYLMTLKPIPNLQSTKAWSAERMKLFPYLDTFLIKTK